MVVRATAAADNSVWAGGAGAVFKGYADVTAVLVEAGAAPDLGSPTARQAAGIFERPDLTALLEA